MCDQDLIHYLDTLKSLSVKIVKLLFATRVADETAYAQLPSFIVSKKKKKNSYKLRNKLVIGCQKIQASKQREIGMISEKARKQRKEMMFRLRS